MVSRQQKICDVILFLYEKGENMEEVIRQIETNKIIVIVRGVEKEKLLPLAQAMYDGGIRLIECTFDATGNVSDEEVAEGIGLLSKHFAGKMIVGAGTVLTEKQVSFTKAAGGKFIISPDTCPEVITFTKKSGLVSIPGAITPTEVASAHRAGADFVKLFPIDLYGPGYVKALRAPLSNVRLLAVGGITADNMKKYLDCGVSGVGVGSAIVDKKMIENENWEAITRLAETYCKQL